MCDSCRMQSERVRFYNQDGQLLSGRIDMPITGDPVAFALYANCFTCDNDLRAIGRITEVLALHGIATFRFDFTGLGDSEGEFPETNFSSNVTDCIAAATFLDEDYQAPELLVGHSLGGSVVLSAAASIPSARAVVTLAAPSSPEHIKRHILGDLDEIRTKGEARVQLAGRQFTIKEQLLADIDRIDLGSDIEAMGKPLLVVHSPTDNTVGVENALEILDHARHPKSFLSLDGADHLISDDADARFAAEIIATWADRYSSVDLAEHAQPDFIAEAPESVTTVHIGREFRTEVISNGFPLVADEPVSVGGTNTGPTPYDYLLTALGACTAITLRMYADRKEWPVESVTVHLTHQKVHARDCAKCESVEGFADHIDRRISIEGDIDEEQRRRLGEIADMCPVHKTLHGEVVVASSLVDA